MNYQTLPARGRNTLSAFAPRHCSEPHPAPSQVAVSAKSGLFGGELSFRLGQQFTLLVGHLRVLQVQRPDRGGNDVGDDGPVTHLWSAGTTYQGAHLVLVADRQSEYARM